MRRQTCLPTHAFVPHMLGHRRSSSGLSSFVEESSPDFLLLTAVGSNEEAEADRALDEGPAGAAEFTGPEKPAAIWSSPEAPEADPAGICCGFGDESPAAFEVAAAFKGVPAAFTGVVAPAVFEGIPADCLPSLALRLLTSFCKTRLS